MLLVFLLVQIQTALIIIKPDDSYGSIDTFLLRAEKQRARKMARDKPFDNARIPYPNPNSSEMFSISINILLYILKFVFVHGLVV